LWALLACIVVPRLAAAAPEIEVRGNRSVSSATIKKLANDVTWDDVNDHSALRDVQEAYIREGYLFASFRLERSAADSTITLVVDEGEAARVEHAKVLGATQFDEATVRDVLRIDDGTRFEPAAVDGGVQELLEMYDRQGFPFTQVWVDSFQIDPESSRVRMTVYVVEGGSKKISRVRIKGLEKTKEDVAVKLSGLRPGETYDGESIRNAYLRLSASGVFEDVAYPTIQISPLGEGVEALINVVEPKRSNSFTAALGYAERNGGSDHVLSGVVRLDLLNIGGALRDLSVFWRNDGSGRIQTELAFRQKFFLGKRMSLGLSLQQIGQDTVYTWQSLGVESGLPVGRLWNGMLGVDFAVNGDRNTFAQGDVANSFRYRLTGGYSYIRGKKIRGRHIDFENRLTYARKQLNYREVNPSQSVTQYIFAAGLRWAFQLGARLHLANQTKVQSLTSQEALVPLSEQFYIGGASTVRGYREDQFHSPQVSFSRTELLLGRSRAENGYLFVDVGYFIQQTPIPSGPILEEGRFITGYGFGLRTQSRAGNVDISFAVGDEFSLQQTKIHLILNRSF